MKKILIIKSLLLGFFSLNNAFADSKDRIDKKTKDSDQYTKNNEELKKSLLNVIVKSELNLSEQEILLKNIKKVLNIEIKEVEINNAKVGTQGWGH